MLFYTAITILHIYVDLPVLNCRLQSLQAHGNKYMILFKKDRIFNQATEIKFLIYN